MRYRCLASAFAIALFGIQGALAQSSSCTVSALVTVVDRHSYLPIDGLAAKEFMAKFQGSEVAIHSVSRAPSPRRFVFVIDRSASMVARHDETPRGAYDPAYLSSAILDDSFKAIPRSDSVALLVFAGVFSDEAPFSDPPTAALKMHELLKWSASGKGNKHRTPLWDNIDAALRMFGTPREGDAIIVVSDGGDNLSKLRQSDLQKRLLAAGVPVLAMKLSDPFAATPEELMGSGEFIELAKNTGGSAIFIGQALSSPDTDVVLHVRPGQLIRLLAHQYRLELEIPALPKPEKWHLELASSDPHRGALILYPRVLPSCVTSDPTVSK